MAITTSLASQLEGTRACLPVIPEAIVAGAGGAATAAAAGCNPVTGLAAAALTDCFAGMGAAAVAQVDTDASRGCRTVSRLGGAALGSWGGTALAGTVLGAAQTTIQGAAVGGLGLVIGFLGIAACCFIGCSSDSQESDRSRPLIEPNNYGTMS
jgi:hypothetical protein